jgi:hypothetical protein
LIDLVAANHTNRELELMLLGCKPLAMFYAYVSELPDERLIPEEAFFPHVKSGQFLREEIVYEDYVQQLKCNEQIKYVFFALPQEAWRIKAMLLLKHSFRKSSYAWNETLERIESALLGYTDDEIDAWCNKASTLQEKNARKMQWT